MFLPSRDTFKVTVCTSRLTYKFSFEFNSMKTCSSFALLYRSIRRGIQITHLLGTGIHRSIDNPSNKRIPEQLQNGGDKFDRIWAMKSHYNLQLWMLDNNNTQQNEALDIYFLQYQI